MNEQAPNEGRRGFLRNALGLGAVAAGGAVSILEMTKDGNIEKESFHESLSKLIDEMKYINQVPVVKTTANESILTSDGWERLDKIIGEKFSHLKGNPDAVLTKKELEKLWNTKGVNKITVPPIKIS